MADYSPLFPRCVSAGEYRLPLHHPDVEVVGARLSALYEGVSLKPQHRALALRLYAELIVADECLWNTIGKISLDDLSDITVRPSRPTLPNFDLTRHIHERNAIRVTDEDGSMIEVADPKYGAHKETQLGFVLRVRDWCKRLEDAYGITAYRKLGRIEERDAEGNLLPEDI